MEQHSSSKGDGEQRSFQQLWGKWSAMLSRLYDDPRVARVLRSRVGQYLRTHPYVAFTAMLFGTMAAVPVGLFLTFALVTMVMSAAGFMFCEALLLAAGLILLSVLCGLALFAVLLSSILNASYFIFFNILKYYSVKKQQQHGAEEESDGETSHGGDHMD